MIEVVFFFLFSTFSCPRLVKMWYPSLIQLPMPYIALHTGHTINIHVVISDSSFNLMSIMSTIVSSIPILPVHNPVIQLLSSFCNSLLEFTVDL